MTTITVQNAAGAYEPAAPEKLYRICLNFYTAQMVEYVRTASHGLLSVLPRDREGRPVTDAKHGIIDADALTPGIQEIKEWVALAAYLKSFPDSDGNGIPEIPVAVPAAGREVCGGALMESRRSHRRRKHHHLRGDRNRSSSPRA